MVKKTLPLLFLILFLFGKYVYAQITIAPIMLFLDEQNRFGTIIVLNGSSQSQEISIEFPFGYPTTNEQGNIRMVYDDQEAAERFGISEAIRGFPTNFTLQPGQRQVVRLTVRPRNFQPGMYWSRIKTTSTPQAPPIGETSEDAITTQITYRFEQITTVFYKYGEVTTGLNIKRVTASRSGEFVQLIADVERTGNAPFLGSISLTVRNDEGEVIEEKRTSTSVYYDYRQVFQIENDRLPPGTYTAQYQFVTERSDVPKSDLVQMEPISRSINFTVK